MDEPIIGINRHKIGSDGIGVTTLVAFHDCPLHCKYCLNPQCLEEQELQRVISPEELFDYVKIDDLYFLATGGGITFGGGEPLLKADFIVEFCKLANPQWAINLESSLNVPLTQLEKVAPYINKYIIDIKDMNPAIYKEYTGSSNQHVLENLRWLINQQPADKILIRLPLIPGHNTNEDRKKSKQQLQEMGYKDFDEFVYIKKKH